MSLRKAVKKQLEEAVSAAEELAGQVPDFRVGEALEAMSEVAKKRKRLRK